MKASELSDKQREVILQIGCSSDHEVVSTEIMEELLAMRIVWHRGEKSIDFTDLGERLYDELATQKQ